MRLLNGLKNAYWRWRLRGVPLAEGFDPQLYCRLHRDVAASGVDGRVHYLRFGIAEGRDPHPDFSASGYRYQRPDLPERDDPFLDFEQTGRQEGYAAFPDLEGGRPLVSGQTTWLVCAHQAGRQLYGGERSLLDVLAYLTELDVNAVVTLPSALNRDYLDTVRKLACRVVVLPYGWWRHGHPPLQQTQAHFEGLLKQYRCDALYVNTSVLDEPLVAARNLGVKTIVHIRELPEHDPDLCATLGANAEQVRARLQKLADIPIANSHFTGKSLGIPETLVVPNSVDMALFEGIDFPVEHGETFSVGIISSNLPKKGIDDFVALALELEARKLEIRCRIIGPDTAYLQQLKKRRAPWPGNLELMGYVSSAEAAIGQVDLLVSLSHIHESFGRTVLEAMAAGRPVVAYDRGAVSDLVMDGRTGFLVPYSARNRIEQVADAVERLFQDADAYRVASKEAANLASERYSRPAVKQAMAELVRRAKT